MSDAKRKVLDMVEQGKISSDEGDSLLSAMNNEKRIGFKILFNPYEHVGTLPGIIVGLVVAVASVGAAMYLNVRYDGFMDIHMAASPVAVGTAMIDQLIAWPVSALILWLIALPFARKSRFVDFLAVLGIARVLQLIAGLTLPPLTPDLEVMSRIASDPTSATGEIVGMIPMIIVAMVLISWFIATLIFAFRHASGLRGRRLVIALIIGIFVTEAASKIILLAV
jgi:hypothetical protein